MKFKQIMRGEFFGHPLHPMLVHLPVGLWIASFVLDLAYVFQKNPNLAVASFYCMAIGLVGALLAASAGAAEYISIPKSSPPKRIATLHMSMNLIITGLYLVNLVSRGALQSDFGFRANTVSPSQFVLSFVSVLLLSVSGYLGGILVFQYGMGHRPRNRKATADLRRIA